MCFWFQLLAEDEGFILFSLGNSPILLIEIWPEKFGGVVLEIDSLDEIVVNWLIRTFG